MDANSEPDSTVSTADTSFQNPNQNQRQPPDLSPRESSIANFLRNIAVGQGGPGPNGQNANGQNDSDSESEDPAQSAAAEQWLQTFMAESGNNLDYLCSTTSGRDSLADQQRKQCLLKLLKFSSIAKLLEPRVVQLFQQGMEFYVMKIKNSGGDAGGISNPSDNSADAEMQDAANPNRIQQLQSMNSADAMARKQWELAQMMVPLLELIEKLPNRSQKILLEKIIGTSTDAESYVWLLEVGGSAANNGVSNTRALENLSNNVEGLAGLGLASDSDSTTAVSSGQGGLALAEVATRVLSRQKGVRSLINPDALGLALKKRFGVSKTFKNLNGDSKSNSSMDIDSENNPSSSSSDDGTIRFRFLQLVSDLATFGELQIPNGFELIADSYLGNDDVLLKLNSLELFSQGLGGSEVGRKFLTNDIVIEKIADELNDPMSISLDGKVAPTCVLFLAYAMRLASKLSKESESEGPNKSESDSNIKAKSLFDRFYKPIMLPLLIEFAQTPLSDPSADTKKLAILKVLAELSQINEEEVGGIEKETCIGGSLSNSSDTPMIFDFAHKCLQSTNIERCKASVVTFIAYASNERNVSSNSISPRLQSLISVTDDMLKVWEHKGSDLRPFVYQFFARVCHIEPCLKKMVSSQAFREQLLEPIVSSESTHDGRMEKHLFLKTLIKAIDNDVNGNNENNSNVAKVLDMPSISAIRSIANRGAYSGGSAANNNLQNRGGGMEVGSMTL